jgi:hypothetical protein
MSDLTLTWAQVHACLAAKYGKRAFDALDDLLCATIGSERLMDEAADEIVRLRAVLDAIDALLGEDGPVGYLSALRLIGEIYDLLHPMTLDDAIDALGTVHK